MDEDTIAARDNGYRLYGNLISAATESLAWGIYLVLFIFAMTIHCRRGPRTPTSLLMLFVTILMFSSSTTLWALNISWSLLRIHNTLITGWDKPWKERIEYNYEVQLTPLGVPMEALFLLNMLLGDAVVVARAKVVWGGSWKVVAVPSFLLFAALVFSITSVVCLELEGFSNTTATSAADSYTCRRAEPIAWVLSIITNIIATSLIALKAWRHRQLSQIALGHPRSSRVHKVLSLMVESGFVYILLLISQLVVFWEDIEPGSASLIAFSVLAPFGDQLPGIYATSVIVLVALHKTHWNGTTTAAGDFLREQDTTDFSNTRYEPSHLYIRKHRRFGHHRDSPSLTEVQFAPPTGMSMMSLDPSPGVAMPVNWKRRSESQSGMSDLHTHPDTVDSSELRKDDARPDEVQSSREDS